MNAAEDRRPLSQISIAALVCAIGGVALPCCPVFPLLAVVLGFASRSRIRRGVPVRGAGMALAAMVLGGLGLLGQGLAFDWLAGRFQEEVESRSLERMERLMEAAIAEDPEGVLEAWPRLHGGRPQEVLDFVAESQSRYGPFESVSVSGWTYGGDFGEPDLLAAALWRFRDRDLTGTFRMRLVPGTSLVDPYPTPVPLKLLIADDRLGDLRLGIGLEDRPGGTAAPTSSPSSSGASGASGESGSDARRGFGAGSGSGS